MTDKSNKQAKVIAHEERVCAEVARNRVRHFEKQAEIAEMGLVEAERFLDQMLDDPQNIQHCQCVNAVAEIVKAALSNLRKTTHGIVDRITLEMDAAEYERLREELGESWEWQGLVRLRTK